MISQFLFSLQSDVFPEDPRRFSAEYQGFSVSMLPGDEREDVERGGKSKILKLENTQYLTLVLKFFSYHASFCS